MQANEDDIRIRFPKPDTDETTKPPSRPKGGVQRTTLSIGLSAASLLLALGATGVSLYMYQNGLQGLQHAQTEVQRGTVNKLVNETRTTAAEAKYAEEMNRLQTANELLRTELLTSQTALARAERERAAMEAGLKGIELAISNETIGNPKFQKVVARAFNQFVDFATPLVDCWSIQPDESKEAFAKRCRGKDLGSLFSTTASPKSNADPFGLLPPTPSPEPSTRPIPETRRKNGIGQPGSHK